MWSPRREEGISVDMNLPLGKVGCLGWKQKGFQHVKNDLYSKCVWPKPRLCYPCPWEVKGSPWEVRGSISWRP